MKHGSARSAAIIPTYNQEAFVEEAVLSIADQVDEVIVVDDHSLDRTFDVLSGIRHPNLTVLRNERNLGVSRTLNRGAAGSVADILLVPGGDDRSLPGRVAAQVAAFDDPAVSLVYSRPSVINTSGQALPDWAAPDFFPTELGADDLANLFFVNNHICSPAAALRRSDWQRAGTFHAGLDLLQDYDMWLRLAEFGRFVELDEPVVEYRKHGENLSRDYVGIDGPRHRKLRAEQDYARNNFLDIASDASLGRLAAAVSLDPSAFAAFARDEKVALLRLAHSDKTVKRRGVEFLIGLAHREDPEAEFARLGLARDQLAKYMYDADHDNMEQVTRALQAGAAPRPVAMSFGQIPQRKRSVLARAFSGSPSVIAKRVARVIRSRVKRA